MRLTWTLFLLLMSACVLGVIYHVGPSSEGFHDYPSVEESIMRLYEQVLQRQPTAQELIQIQRDIEDDKITMVGLRERLMNSDEYARNMKLQTNALNPEMERMIYQTKLLNEIAKIYQEERKEVIPPRMVLPLRDIYASLNYNPNALRALLRSQQYVRFEQDAKRDAGLSKEAIMDLYAKSFDPVAITQSAAVIAATSTDVSKTLPPSAATVAKEESAKRTQNASVAELNAASNLLLATFAKVATEAAAAQQAPKGTDVNASSVSRGIHDTDMNSSQYIQKMHSGGFDVHQNNIVQVPMPNKGQMVLRPEYKWSVPQSRAPVCNTLNQKPLVQPLMNNSELLLGTPLEDAQDTAVGSIMPKFDYKEFVEVPNNNTIAST